MTTALKAARQRMTDTMVEEEALQSVHWIDAFRSVPRETFVPRFTIGYGNEARVYEQNDAGYPEATYTDTSLVTRWDSGGSPISSSSAPSLMARMLEAFTPAAGSVLEIGTGTGYNCALLCHRFGADQVVSVDIDPELTANAREKLAALGYAPNIVTGDGTAGHPDRAPYGGILATCGVDRIPPAWLRQVCPGGIIVTNIGSGIVRLTVDDAHNAAGGFLSDAAKFMRARPAPEHVTEKASTYTKLIARGAGPRLTARLPEHPEGAAAVLRELVHAEALEISLNQPEVVAMSLIPAEGTTVRGLVHPPTGSWARITSTEENNVEVVHVGALDLWAERISLLGGWINAGRPGPDQYGLTVTADGVHTLWRGDGKQLSWVLPD